MDLRDYVRLLRVRRVLILACALLGLAAAGAATLAATPVYEARSVLFVSTGDTTNVGSAYTGNLFTQQRVKSYTTIIDSPRVLSEVVDELGLDTTPQALAGQVTADAPLDTVLINVTVNDTSPQEAQAIANAVSTQFTRIVDQLERGEGEAASLVKVSVVTPASLPGSPVSPRPTLNLALGLLVGLAVGVGAAVAKETLDTTIKGPDELQERYGVATLAVVPMEAGAGKDPLAAATQPGSLRAEAFRQLRTNLQFVDVDADPTSFLITSSLPGEGKTTSACNLAITLAAAGVRTVLVDADLRRPKMAEYLGLEGAVGLTDVLVGRATLQDALQEWGTTGNLRILPSGSRPPNPSELLGSQHMADLIATLEEDALVVIDAPPLLPVTDAAVLAPRVSGAVLIVRAGKTRREQIERAVGSLRSVNASVYGAVLNMASIKGPDAYTYGYGYAYKTEGRRRAPKDTPTQQVAARQSS